MNKAFLVKYAEVALKGKNRKIFEEKLVKQIRLALKRVDGEFKVTRPQGRVFVEAEGDCDEQETIEALQKVFGITAICPVVLTEDNGFDDLAEKLVAYIDEQFPQKDFTFKVFGRRSRKNYPMNSMELCAALGEKILDAFPTLKVDVHNPEVRVNVEIRERINFYVREYPGPGGMPIPCGPPRLPPCMLWLALRSFSTRIMSFVFSI